ncbi:hypothetical protein A2118_00280 [Candidatus Kaiserbacteria bacterium GWA2_50_9]|uniref:Uncharacterized protein n=1 Tax=Candidatus Kaiserbacteria bacterium GWA2_50_9 TaxID=1798474 RepID=A0A1F6BW75_9BACT|nr:MAG: hypothetical protein A2118_00280 [Candidatus Kaiserbacteria bacterium GWA2_50_9]
MKIPFLILIALLLVGGGTYAYMQKRQVGTPVAENSSIQMTSSVRSQLAIDLSIVTPQFIDSGNYSVYSDGRPFLDYIMNIKKDLEMIPIFKEAMDNSASETEVLLKAIGKRYVLLHMPGGKDMGEDVVFDSVTQQISDVISWPRILFKTDTFAVYVSPDDICTYTLDQPSCVPLPNAKLSNQEELYWDPMGGPVELKETHTDTSLTISVYNRSDGGRMLRKSTFTLP